MDLDSTYGVNDGAAHTPPRHCCDLWQFTSAGRVPGIGGNVDCNALNGKRDLASFTAGAKPVEPQKPEQADPSQPLHILVGNALSGMYGNGADRQAALGGRYGEVQAAVNHICSAKTSVLADEALAGKWGNGDERKRASAPATTRSRRRSTAAPASARSPSTRWPTR